MATVESQVLSTTEPITLSTPLKVGDVELRNRNIMSAMTRNRSLPVNVPNEANVEYYTQRAEGGAGLIVTEGVLVSPQGSNWPNAPGLWSKEHVEGWKKPVAIADPRTIVEEFRVAGANAKEAGFDGVEVHSANGYVISQFLDNTANHRTDEWGGSAENRTRFGLEIVKAQVEIWGPGRVGIKVSPAGGYNDMGMSLEDTLETYSYYVKELVALNLAYITLLRYRESTDIEFDGKKRATPHDVLASYGPILKHAEARSTTKLFLNGGLSSAEANELLGSQKIDGAVFGWLWIGNPDLQTRFEKGAELVYMPDASQLYHSKSDPPRGGYSDYPKGNY
ncbi:hypothetical protein FRB90_001026 [Tulasnella sp. 427]|nr:hypothetical protein FRB90_001026 [Tulasnella sp. 427]